MVVSSPDFRKYYVKIPLNSVPRSIPEYESVLPVVYPSNEQFVYFYATRIWDNTLVDLDQDLHNITQSLSS